MTTKPVTEAEVDEAIHRVFWMTETGTRRERLKKALEDFAQSRAAEAVGAVPVTDAEIIARCNAAGVRWCEPDGEDGGYPGGFDMSTMAEMRRLLYTAPPSTAPKAQDDLAGAGVEKDFDTGDNDLDVLLEATTQLALGPEHNNMDTGIYWYEAMRKVVDRLASQPKAPAPVPVVQGEAVDWSVQIMQDWVPRKLRLTIGVQSFDIDVQDEADEPGRMEWFRDRLIKAIQRLAATPPGGAGGDVGAVKCDFCDIGTPKRRLLNHKGTVLAMLVCDHCGVEYAGAEQMEYNAPPTPVAEQVEANPGSSHLGGGASGGVQGPLTDEQIDKEWRKVPGSWPFPSRDFRRLARVIEAAHGIGKAPRPKAPTSQINPGSAPREDGHE